MAFNHYAKIEAFYEKTGDTANESYLKTLLNIIQYCQSVGDASKMEALETTLLAKLGYADPYAQDAC